jgi:hypothetical protein
LSFFVEPSQAQTETFNIVVNWYNNALITHIGGWYINMTSSACHFFERLADADNIGEICNDASHIAEDTAARQQWGPGSRPASLG